MKKTSCNITKDLLPLYLEEICSEDSREYVEAHMQECKKCRESYELLKGTVLSCQEASAQEINAMKKWKKNVTDKFFYLYLLFVTSILLSTILLMVNVNHLASYTWFLFLLMPLTMLATAAVFNRRTRSASLPLYWRLLFTGQALLVLYSLVLTYTVINSALYGNDFFSIPLDRTGPFLSSQYTLCSLISLSILALHLYQAATKKVCYTPASSISILCFFVNLNLHSMLYAMSEIQTLLWHLEHSTIILLFIGSLTILLLTFMEHRLSKKQKLFQYP